MSSDNFWTCLFLLDIVNLKSGRKQCYSSESLRHNQDHSSVSVPPSNEWRKPDSIRPRVTRVPVSHTQLVALLNTDVDLQIVGTFSVQGGGDERHSQVGAAVDFARVEIVTAGAPRRIVVVKVGDAPPGVSLVPDQVVGEAAEIILEVKRWNPGPCQFTPSGTPQTYSHSPFRDDLQASVETTFMATARPSSHSLSAGCQLPASVARGVSGA